MIKLPYQREMGITQTDSYLIIKWKQNQKTLKEVSNQCEEVGSALGAILFPQCKKIKVTMSERNCFIKKDMLLKMQGKIK